jgi:hypothetical protein
VVSRQLALLCNTGVRPYKLSPAGHAKSIPWNKAKLLGANPPLRPSNVWAIRTKLQVEGRKRGLAPFNLAVDGKRRQDTP